uniref:Uncharacterized protein n=1 Tax=Cannabis sativa TaxID=3483 RepID=A0A803Q740_CANSA
MPRKLPPVRSKEHCVSLKGEVGLILGHPYLYDKIQKDESKKCNNTKDNTTQNTKVMESEVALLRLQCENKVGKSQGKERFNSQLSLLSTDEGCPPKPTRYRLVGHAPARVFSWELADHRGSPKRAGRSMPGSWDLERFLVGSWDPG